MLVGIVEPGLANRLIRRDGIRAAQMLPIPGTGIVDVSELASRKRKLDMVIAAT